jgi:hypothetical protein
MTTLLTHAAELKLILHAAEKYAVHRGCSCVEEQAESATPVTCAACRIEEACGRIESALRHAEVDALRRRLMGGAA